MAFPFDPKTLLNPSQLPRQLTDYTAAPQQPQFQPTGLQGLFQDPNFAGGLGQLLVTLLGGKQGGYAGQGFGNTWQQIQQIQRQARLDEEERRRKLEEESLKRAELRNLQTKTATEIEEVKNKGKYYGTLAEYNLGLVEEGKARREDKKQLEQDKLKEKRLQNYTQIAARARQKGQPIPENVRQGLMAEGIDPEYLEPLPSDKSYAASTTTGEIRMLAEGEGPAPGEVPLAAAEAAKYLGDRLENATRLKVAELQASRATKQKWQKFRKADGTVVWTNPDYPGEELPIGEGPPVGGDPGKLDLAKTNQALAALEEMIGKDKWKAIPAVERSKLVADYLALVDQGIQPTIENLTNNWVRRDTYGVVDPRTGMAPAATPPTGISPTAPAPITAPQPNFSKLTDAELKYLMDNMPGTSEAQGAVAELRKRRIAAKGK